MNHCWGQKLVPMPGRSTATTAGTDQGWRWGTSAGCNTQKTGCRGPDGREQKAGGSSKVKQAPGLLVTGAAVGLGLGGIC